MATGWPMKVTYANGDVFSADDINSTNGTINLLQTSTLSNQAGKNCIINGGMDIFQRSTFATYNAYSLDRWYIGSSNNVTVTQSTAKLTPNSQYMMLMTASTTQQIYAYQVIETKNAIYYAGKTVTLSAYAAGLTTTTNLIMVLQYSTSVDVGMGGSWTDITVASGSANLTLSSTVTRWSAQYAVPSTAKSLRVLFVNNAANITVGQGIYLGDVQLELGSYATSFSRAGGTIQGELAACQRYFYAMTSNSTGGYSSVGVGAYYSTTNCYVTTWMPVEMRTQPTYSGTGSYVVLDAGTTRAVSAITLDQSTNRRVVIYATTGATTAGRAAWLTSDNNTTAVLSFSSEL